MKKKIHFYNVSFILLVVSIVTGCAVTVFTAPQQEQVMALKSSPAEGKAIIYVLRKKEFAGCGGYLKLYLNNNYWGEVACGLFLAAQVEPGDHVLVGKAIAGMGGPPEPAGKYYLPASSGEKYFLLHHCPSGPPSWEFLRLSNVTAENDIKKFKLSAANNLAYTLEPGAKHLPQPLKTAATDEHRPLPTPIVESATLKPSVSIAPLPAHALPVASAKDKAKDNSIARLEAKRLERIKKSRDENVPKLKSSDPEMRAKAARDLAFDGVEEALPELVKLLKDPDPAPRGSATGAIGDLGGHAYVDEIAALLHDSNAGVRQYAAGALKDLGAKRYAPEIAALLSDSDWRTRATALHALGDLGASRFIPKIAKHLNSRRCGEAGAAATALGLLGARQYGERMIGILRRHPKCGSTFLRAFGYLGDRSYEGDLARYLRAGRNESIKGDAALALAELGATRYADEVASLLMSGGNGPGKAALALGLMRSKKHSSAVAQLVTGRSSMNTSKAAQALGLMGATDQADAVADLLRKDYHLNYCAAIWSLGRLKSAKHARLVASYLEYKGSCYIHDLDTHWYGKKRVDVLAKEALLRMGLDPAKVKPEYPKLRRRFR